MRTSQLLILGNGFDLHCGLQSSYKDFFQSTILDTIGERFALLQMKADQLINTYGKTLSNKDQGKNLTHKLLLENRLKIVEIS